MEALSDDNPIFERFKTPAEYLNNRRPIEKWIWEQFTASGGKPKSRVPIYAVLGQSNWLEANLSVYDMSKIQIPLAIFQEADISFTYPDSMVTYNYSLDKTKKYYRPEYHGRLFKLAEIDVLLPIYQQFGETGMATAAQGHSPYIEYIEAQIWNHELVHDYLRSAK
jgi:hypothetical protein